MTVDAPNSVPLDNDGRDTNRPPTMPFLDMRTRADGASTIALSQMSGFGQQSVGGKAAPMWMRPFPGRVVALYFTALPFGWFGDWHESPKPQWVVTLRGRWFIETMDGERVEMGPGDTHFGRDQGTTDGKGHQSGQLGDAPCFQLFVQFDPSPAADTPDPFR